MSSVLRIAITTIIVTILHSYVSAQAPTCLAGYTSLYNSLNQSPCTMAIFLGGACTGGVFSLDPLEPGFIYLGPSRAAANPCRCSTVYYSLLSACAYCQNQSFLSWTSYDSNCTAVYNQIFVDPIPTSTKIPHYAYLDVVTNDTFSPAAAEIAGGPESSAVPQATGSSTTIVSSTSAAGNNKSKSNAGAIAGGVIGGVVFLGTVAGLVTFIIMRRGKRSSSSGETPSTYYSSVASPETVVGYADGKGDTTLPSSMGSGRVYDPNDPSTFPTSGPLGNSTYSNSPALNQPSVINPIFPANPAAARPQYSGAPEL